MFVEMFADRIFKGGYFFTADSAFVVIKPFPERVFSFPYVLFGTAFALNNVHDIGSLAVKVFCDGVGSFGYRAVEMSACFHKLAGFAAFLMADVHTWSVVGFVGRRLVTQRVSS